MGTARDILPPMTDQQEAHMHDVSRKHRAGLGVVVSSALTHYLTQEALTMPAWAHEVRAVARAAAASGDFRNALVGYELVGKYLGALNNTSGENHLHIHRPTDIDKLSTSQLRDRLVEVEASVGGDDDDQAIFE